MKITIDVTQEDIDKGVRGDCAACPVALAVEREAKIWCGASAHRLVFRMPGKWGGCKTPNSVRSFIFDFDAGIEVSPITFEVDFTWQDASKI